MNIFNTTSKLETNLSTITTTTTDEQDYKIVSTSSVALEHLLIPILNQNIRILNSTSKLIHNSINSCINSINSFTCGIFTCCFYPCLTLNNCCQKLSSYLITTAQQDSIHSVNVMIKGLDKKQQEIEKVLKLNFSTKHESWMFSTANKKTLSKILKAFTLNFREFQKISILNLLLYLRAYSKIQKIATRNIDKVAVELNSENATVIKDLNYYKRFAFAIYGSVTKDGGKTTEVERFQVALIERFCKDCEIDLADVVHIQFDSKEVIPAHGIIILKEKKEIILIIRGTIEFTDLISDLNSEYMEYKFEKNNFEKIGFVHKGMFLASTALAKYVKPAVLATLKENQGFKVVICGHSLGAAVSTFACMIWMQDPDFDGIGLRAYAYGPPPIVSESLNTILISKVTSCIYGYDYVSRLCEGTLRDLGEVVKFFHHMEYADNCLKICRTKTKSIAEGSQDEQFIINLYKEIHLKCNNPKLEVPGKILHILHKKVHKNLQEGGHLIYFPKNNEFDELLLTSSFIKDHSAIFYIPSLNDLQSTLIEVSDIN